MPGGISLHNCMLPHGPDNEAFKKATTQLGSGQARRHDELHVRDPLSADADALCGEEAPLQDDYVDCWAGHKRKFDGTPGLK